VSDRFQTVAKVGEIPEGGVKVVRVDGDAVAVFHVGGAYYGLADICTHDGGSLADGARDGYEVECARHGARFDIRTGAALTLPAVEAVPTHAVRVIGDQVQVACDSCEDRRAAQSAADAAPAPKIPPATAAAPAGDAAAAPRPAPTQQEFAVRAALETVMDPEIQLSVMDLGLVREIRIEPARTLIRMVLTTPFCPYAPQLTADVKQAAMSVLEQPCEVEILPDPWSPEMMPDPGLLGFST
jgi:3-phenylpropionate/trans-cinnamate dioxygenase ferredoxin component